MKNTFLLLALVLGICFGLSEPATWAAPSTDHVQSEARKTVDPTLVPFSKGELQQQLRANKDNLHAQILLLLRADEMSTSRIDRAFLRPNSDDPNAQALKALDEMRWQAPDNMNVLAAYAFAFDIGIQGAHHEFTHYEKWSPLKEQEFQAMLKKLYEKAPRLWVTYLIDGYRRFYFGSKAPSEQNKGLQLLRKAVELAPTVPLVHARYASANSLAADWQKKPSLYGIATKEGEKAISLNPPSSVAALGLLMSYGAGWLPDGKPNLAKAKVAAQRYLSMLPDGYVFAEYEHIVFKSAGIPLPQRQGRAGSTPQ